MKLTYQPINVAAKKPNNKYILILSKVCFWDIKIGMKKYLPSETLELMEETKAPIRKQKGVKLCVKH